MRIQPHNPSPRPTRPRAFTTRYARRIVIWLLTLLIRFTIAVALLLTLRWIVLRFRRVRIRPTPYATPPIGPEAIDTKRRRIVLSDLHLGGGDRRDDFCDDEVLIAFLEHYVAHEPTELILAGDTFEFLQISLPDVADDEWSQRAAARRLQAIIAAHAGVFAALRRFAQQAGNQLTILIGNHDFELHYPAAKEVLRQTLGLPPDDPRLRFGISYHGGGVYIVHGNQFDRWNRFVNFASISEPFEVVRGTQLVKEVINELEEDPFPLAPLVDNIKPSSAFFWYLISLQRLRDPAARRFVTRGVIGFLQVTAWAPPHHLSSEPDEWLQRSPLIVLWPPIAALRRRRVARHQAIARQFGAAAEAVGDLPEMVDQVRDEARRQASREVATFNDEIARDIARLACQPAYRDDRLFVCGHTHVARVIDLGNGRRYINVGTWTDVVFDVETMRRPRQRYPFLEISNGSDGAPHGRLLVWYGPDQPPQPWYDEEPPRQRRQSRVQYRRKGNGVTAQARSREDHSQRGYYVKQEGTMKHVLRILGIAAVVGLAIAIFRAVRQYQEDSVFDLTPATNTNTANNSGQRGSISPELLSMLADPGDKGPVELMVDANGKEWLVNRRNGYRYPIEDGIPIMLLEEGEKNKDESLIQK